jgi:hypothetical protein
MFGPNFYSCWLFCFIYFRIVNVFHLLLRDLSFREKKTNEDRLHAIQSRFKVLLVLMIDRTAAPTDGSDRLEDSPYFANYPENLGFLREWENQFAIAQDSISQRWSHLRDPVPPGTPLDGTFFRCLQDRSYIHTLSDAKKQLMKRKIWRAGNVLRALNNCSWPEMIYHRYSNIY